MRICSLVIFVMYSQASHMTAPVVVWSLIMSVLSTVESTWLYLCTYGHCAFKCLHLSAFLFDLQ